MKVKYDKETDILYIRLSDLAIAESDEEKRALYWIKLPFNPRKWNMNLYEPSFLIAVISNIYNVKRTAAC